MCHIALVLTWSVLLNELKVLLILQMRHVYLVIDSSRSMEDTDLRPNRFIATLKVNCVWSMELTILESSVVSV